MHCRCMNSSGLVTSILTPYSWWYAYYYYSLGAGATDLLVEWEDMFPYWGPIANISAKWVHVRLLQHHWSSSLLLGIPTQSLRSPHCYRSSPINFPSSQILSTHSFPLPGSVSHFGFTTGGKRERSRSDSSCPGVQQNSEGLWDYEILGWAIRLGRVATMYNTGGSSFGQNGSKRETA